MTIKSKILLLTPYAFVAVFFMASPLLADQENGEASQCLETDTIISYMVESDEAVRFTLADNKNVIMSLKPHCPQLRFHGYVSFTPVNGKLCAGVDEIKTRAGLPCRISGLSYAQEGSDPVETTP
ncbi:DUF6491 family protein [Kordiimonas pumila]|uniref:DUF6491 family protein n=1 Tax=Kordiimonas pumila TaxID=2161677 RepID=A0ABV7D990_9PROT|nr:DUF6491 family protein [Kordiimonas pumila]